jgi:hypothetical protein
MTIEAASGEISTDKRNSTYQTGRKCMQDMDYTLERFHHFAVVSSKASEGPCLLLKDRGNGLNRITIFELPGERMVDQFHPCLFFIVMQGSLEEGLKHSRWVTHTHGSNKGSKEYGYK